MAKLGNLILLAVVGYAGWNAYDKSSEREQRLNDFAAHHNLNVAETEAFKICQGQMKDKTLNVTDHFAIAVPMDVCGCHAPAMTKAFNDGQYGSHANVVDFLVGEKDKDGNSLPRKKEPTPVNANHLKPGKTQDGVFIEMALSLGTCAKKQVAAEKAEKQRKCKKPRQGEEALCEVYKKKGLLDG